MSSQLSYLSLLPGAFAGTSVDLALYPVDTIKVGSTSLAVLQIDFVVCIFNIFFY